MITYRIIEACKWYVDQLKVFHLHIFVVYSIIIYSFFSEFYESKSSMITVSYIHANVEINAPRWMNLYSIEQFPIISADFNAPFTSTVIKSILNAYWILNCLHRSRLPGIESSVRELWTLTWLRFLRSMTEDIWNTCLNESVIWEERSLLCKADSSSVIHSSIHLHSWKKFELEYKMILKFFFKLMYSMYRIRIFKVKHNNNTNESNSLFWLRISNKYWIIDIAAQSPIAMLAIISLIFQIIIFSLRYHECWLRWFIWRT